MIAHETEIFQGMFDIIINLTPIKVSCKSVIIFVLGISMYLIISIITEPHPVQSVAAVNTTALTVDITWSPYQGEVIFDRYR